MKKHLIVMAVAVGIAAAASGYFCVFNATNAGIALAQHACIQEATVQNPDSGMLQNLAEEYKQKMNLTRALGTLALVCAFVCGIFVALTICVNPEEEPPRI